MSQANAATPIRLLRIVKNAKNRVGSNASASARAIAWAAIAATTRTIDPARTRVRIRRRSIGAMVAVPRTAATSP